VVETPSVCEKSKENDNKNNTNSKYLLLNSLMAGILRFKIID
jgi:hypothetical protein